MNHPEAALESHIASTLQALSPCSAGILVSRNGDLLFERYLPGMPQDPSQDIGQNSLWPWWSLTKSVTAALVITLIAKGLLSFDQPISDHLPEFREPGPGPFDRRKVLLRHILCHTSGCALPGREEDGIRIDGEVDLSRVGLETEPGTAFVYSALGMHILERFIEAAAREDYAALVRRGILEPFGIGEVRYVFGHDLIGNPGLRSRALACDNGRIVPSQHHQRTGLGLYGRAKDILAFGERWLTMRDATGQPWGRPDLRNEAWTRHSTRPSDGSDYGLLWWLFQDEGACIASGASYSLCVILPKEGIVAAVARNHFGGTAEPFDYKDEKLKVLELARRFA